MRVSNISQCHLLVHEFKKIEKSLLKRTQTTWIPMHDLELTQGLHRMHQPAKKNQAASWSTHQSTSQLVNQSTTAGQPNNPPIKFFSLLKCVPLTSTNTYLSTKILLSSLLCSSFASSSARERTCMFSYYFSK